MRKSSLSLLCFFMFAVFCSSWADEQEEQVEQTDSHFRMDFSSVRNPFASKLPKKIQPTVEPGTPEKSRSETRTEAPPEDRRTSIDAARNLPQERPAIQLQITGLVWNTERPQAIVNSQVVSVGDTIGGNKIIAIRREGIEVLRGEQRFFLELKK